MKLNKIISFAIVGICVCFAALANDCRNDPVRNRTVSCDDSCEKDWKGKEGARLFCNFPQISTCRDGGFLQDDYWRGCGDMFCAGYSREAYDEAIMEPVADKWKDKADFYSACWKWKCKDGYLEYRRKCITQTDCRAMNGMDVSDDKMSCVSSKWCNEADKAAYRSDLHDVFEMGACQSYKCKPGRCFSSPTERVCVDAEPGIFGGKYAEPETGACGACKADSYVNSDATGCVRGTEATRVQLKDCYDKDDAAEFATCAANGASGVNCPVGSTHDASKTALANGTATTKGVVAATSPSGKYCVCSKNGVKVNGNCP